MAKYILVIFAIVIIVGTVPANDIIATEITPFINDNLKIQTNYPTPDPKVLQNWTAIAAPTNTPHRVAHATVYDPIGDKIYMIGGFPAGTGGTQVALCQEYDPVTNTWTDKAPMSTARNWIKGSYVRGKIYVIGGITTAGTTTTINEEYTISTNTWTTKAPRPSARACNLEAVWRDSLIYCLGGWDGVSGSQCMLVDIYDPFTNTWSSGTPLPFSADMGSCVIIGDTIYITNAVNRGATSTCWPSLYKGAINPASPTTITWIAGPVPPSLTSITGTAAIGNDIYWLGGFVNLTTGSSTLWKYNRATGVISTGPAYLYTIARHNFLVSRPSAYELYVMAGDANCDWTTPNNYYYKITFPPPATNDVGVDEILSPGAYHTPGTLMTPSARIQNYGIATQTNFQTVCSIVGAGLSYTSTKIVASLAGGTTTTVNFDTLRPTTTGICTVKIRTNLLNDTNPANDRKTKTCNISNIAFIIIGTGTATQRYPLGMYWGHERSAGLYLGSEIGATGTINEIAWYIQSLTTAANGPVKIYLKTTTATTLTAMTWATMIAGATLVYDGTPTFTAGDWFSFTFTSPFSFTSTSDNLLVLVETNYGGTGGESSTAKAIRYSTATSRHQYWQADNSPPTGNGTVTANLPNVRLAMTTQPPPANDVGVQEIRAPGAMHPINTLMTPIAVVKNYGTATQTNFSVICSIVGPTQQVRYTNTKTVTSLAPGDTIRVNFDAWLPSYAEYESVYMRTTLATDEVPTNDRKSRATEVYSAILLERFDDVTFPPTGWTVLNFGGGDSWVRQTSYFYSAPACAYIYYDLPNNDWLITPRIRRTGPSDSLIFWYRNHTTSISYYESLLVRVSNNANVADTSRYTIIGTIENFNNITWWRAAYHLTPYGESLYIAFHYKNYDDWGMAVDDIRVSGVVGILEEKPNKLPTITMLNAPKPNPVTDGLAKISFTIAEPTRASLKIYDASGRIIKTLVNELMSPGVYNLVWNGTDDNSNKVAEGIYFYTLTTDNQNITKKLVYTR